MKNILSKSEEIIRHIKKDRIESEIKDLELEIKELFSHTVSQIHSVLKGLEIEGEETGEAVKTFFDLLKSKLGNNPRPSDEEIKQAIHQISVEDVKIAVIGTLFLVVPGGVPLTALLGLVAKHFGFSIFPNTIPNR
jgi:hypothetical protein